MPDSRPKRRPRRRIARAILVLLLLIGLEFISLSDAAGQWKLPSNGGVPRCRNDIGISPGSFGDVPDEHMLRDLGEIQRVGATRIRLDIDWSGVEPQRDKYDWKRTDLIVKAIAEARLNPLVMLGYAPKWAQVPGVATDSHGPPANPEEFAQFARAVVQRYGSIVHTWEIWNEPNLAGFWLPEPDAAAYSNLVRVTSAAIKQVQPNATVIAGALSSGADSNYGEVDPLTFVADMYKAGARGTFDALSVHPYTFPSLPTDPDPNGTNTFRKIPQLHRIMEANGDRKDVWITEFGAPTGTNRSAVTPEGQVDTLAIGIAAARSLGYVPAIFVYSIRDAGTNPDDLYQNFGLMSKSYVPKPAYRELKILTALTEC